MSLWLFSYWMHLEASLAQQKEVIICHNSSYHLARQRFELLCSLSQLILFSSLQGSSSALVCMWKPGLGTGESMLLVLLSLAWSLKDILAVLQSSQSSGLGTDDTDDCIALFWLLKSILQPLLLIITNTKWTNIWNGNMQLYKHKLYSLTHTWVSLLLGNNHLQLLCLTETFLTTVDFKLTHPSAGKISCLSEYIIQRLSSCTLLLWVVTTTSNGWKQYLWRNIWGFCVMESLLRFHFLQYS